MPPRRVLFLCPSGQVGGAERCLLSLAAGFDPARYQPCALIGSPGPLADLLAAAGVPAALAPLPAPLRRFSRFHSNPGPWAKLAPAFALPGYVRRLRRAMAAMHPDGIHSNGLKMHLLAAWPRRGGRGSPGKPGSIPLIWHLHEFPPPPGGVADRLLAWLAPRPALALANSQAVADAYALRYPALADQLRVLHNGVDVAAFRNADGAVFRRACGFDSADFVIGMVAIFAPWKGQEVFLRAARIALDRQPSIKFLLVGDDIYDTAGHGGRRRELDALAGELRLGESLRWSGFLAGDIAPAYAALDLAVHASTRPEPFGRAVIEAMAAGVAVIAAGAGGIPEIIRDGRDGRLTPPGDSEALAAAMLDLHGDPERRRRLAAQGQLRVETSFSQSAIAAALQDLYDGLPAPAAGRAGAAPRLNQFRSPPSPANQLPQPRHTGFHAPNWQLATGNWQLVPLLPRLFDKGVNAPLVAIAGALSRRRLAAVPPRGRWVAIKLVGLGDAVLMLPALAAIRAAGCRLAILATPRCAAIFQAPGVADQVIVLEPRAFWRGLGAAWRALRQADGVLDFEQHVYWSTLLALAVPGRRLGLRVRARVRNRAYHATVDPAPAAGDGPGPRHMKRIFDDLARLGGFQPAAPLLAWPLHADAPAAADAWLAARGLRRGHYFLLAPGSGATVAFRRLPPDRWADIAVRLAASAPVVLAGAGSDASLLDAILDSIARAAGAAPHRALALPLPVLASLMAGARAVVAIDSGPMHLAAAMDAPVVGIFGPDSPRRYAPLNDRSVGLTLDLPCSPCNNCFVYREARCVNPSRFACIQGIAADTVVDAALQLSR